MRWPLSDAISGPAQELDFSGADVAEEPEHCFGIRELEADPLSGFPRTFGQDTLGIHQRPVGGIAQDAVEDLRREPRTTALEIGNLYANRVGSSRNASHRGGIEGCGQASGRKTEPRQEIAVHETRVVGDLAPERAATDERIERSTLEPRVTLADTPGTL